MQNNQPTELWGGIECTINRVGDRYLDQIQRSGHEQRDSDVEDLCALGIKAIRYPVLWERYGRQNGRDSDCSLAKHRIARFQELGVEPIVGLLHHGSGPSDTSLVDHDFPQKFADYAFHIARQLPAVRFFTPINEPLTTARFSGLYGHWYPHHRSDKSFLLALTNQIEGIRLAMDAIHSVNPQAKLVQTENIEQCHSTPQLQYQAVFENARRWLSIDLLLGRFTNKHFLWSYVEHFLDDLTIIERLNNRPVRIDVMGWNYYATSERFLDQNLDRYPGHTHGGNGRDRYADVEALRVLAEGLEGLDGLLRQAWERYQLPTAITEVHLGCHRESQLRWIINAWQTVQRLREEGVDLRAMTVWSLLGNYDWDSLCTMSRSHYEPGAFDSRSGRLRPTSMASLIKTLSRSTEFDHPALLPQGWWEIPSRLTFGDPECQSGSEDEYGEGATRTIANMVYHEADPSATAKKPPLLITGQTGTLGRAFGEICTQRRLPHCLFSRAELDITDLASIEKAIELYQPWAIINTAGFVRVDDAEHAREACFEANTEGARLLASASSKYQIPLITFSTDLVFDGKQSHAYTEQDVPRALNVYGESKLAAERAVLQQAPQSLVVRTSGFFGPWDDYNFLTISLQKLERGEKVVCVNDWIVSPTYVPDLVHSCLDLLIDGANGLWHLANQGQISWHDLLFQAASILGLETRNIVGRRLAEHRFAAARPAYSALTSRHGGLLPILSESVEIYCAQWQSISARSLQFA